MIPLGILLDQSANLGVKAAARLVYDHWEPSPTHKLGENIKIVV
jgi:hypothetical protein